MALSSCFLSSQVCVSLRVDRPKFRSNTLHNNNNIISQRCTSALKSKNTEMFGHQAVEKEVNQHIGWSFLKGSRTISRPNLGRNIMCRKSSVVYASWLPCSEIASGAFTLGTAAVLPFYTLMVVAPQAKFFLIIGGLLGNMSRTQHNQLWILPFLASTKKLVASSLPYMVLGALYAYLLYLSWTPDTMRFMFASKYWLPELPGIAKMFSSEMTLASAWIHLLAVDLFAARQVYDDGLQNNIETRHSVSLCLLFCPVGILAHFITKALTRSSRGKNVEFNDEVTISGDFIRE